MTDGDSKSDKALFSGEEVGITCRSNLTASTSKENKEKKKIKRFFTSSLYLYPNLVQYQPDTSISIGAALLKCHTELTIHYLI